MLFIIMLLLLLSILLFSCVVIAVVDNDGDYDGVDIFVGVVTANGVLIIVVVVVVYVITSACIADCVDCCLASADIVVGIYVVGDVVVVHIWLLYCLC